MKNLILLNSGLIEVNSDNAESNFNVYSTTFVSNLMHYGFIPNNELFSILNSLPKEELFSLWKQIKPALEEVTGANRKMSDFVVYKNFPEEVIKMDEFEYWTKQICMYIGFPNELFVEEEKKRKPLNEKIKFKVLAPAKSNSMDLIYQSLLTSTTKWSDSQFQFIEYFLDNKKDLTELSLNDFSFKINGIFTINKILEKNLNISFDIKDATDVLRLAVAMSEGDLSLRTNTKFRKFKRSERRMLLSLLDKTNNLEDDFAMRKGQWKALLRHLHPNDYKFKNVSNAYDSLYNNKCKTFESKVKQLIFKVKPEIKGCTKCKVDLASKLKDNLSKEDIEQLERLQKELSFKTKKFDTSISKEEESKIYNELEKLLLSRTGYLYRNFHFLYSIFEKPVVLTFKKVIPELTTLQLIKFEKYINSINDRKKLMYAPNGNWNKVVVEDNNKTKIHSCDVSLLTNSIKEEINKRLSSKFTDGITLKKSTQNVFLKTNDQELANYGRGTVFDIPKNVKFIRTASFWSCVTNGNNFFDNGWNFFDEDWKPKGTCCWNNERFKVNNKVLSVFSGDPTNSKELDGKACQMIDLYLDKLEVAGVRYAVWNILSYSNIPFSEANDVLASLMWGKKPMSGNTFEPSRVNMSFPLQGNNLTKYIAYIDIKERKLVYVDANLRSSIQSAGNNETLVSELMPAYIEYLSTLPTVFDLFKSLDKKGDTVITYSDKNVDLKDEESAYVFKPSNEKNSFTQIDLEKVINLK